MKLSELLLEEFKTIKDDKNKFKDITQLTASYKDALYMEGEIFKANNPVDIDELEEEWDANK